MNLLNRTTFIQAVGQVSSKNDSNYTLIYSEINHALKVASLMQGVAAEEQLIKTVQLMIYSRIKHFRGAYMTKLGRDRFAMILKLPVKESLEVAEDLAQFLDNQSVDIEGFRYYPKLIIGITSLSSEYKTPERIMAAMDEALFQSRRAGNSIVKRIEHDDPVLNEYYDALKLLPTITDGLKQQSFILFAQPIVAIDRLGTGQQKFEVLLRCKNQQGIINDNERLFHASELFNISRELDFYVIRQFCRFLALQKPSDTSYSLNISASTIRYNPFLDVLEKEFKKYNINPEQVCFEITETVADRDYQQAIHFMNVLKNRLGCQLSLDDIGIGSSNLANLSKFNVDFLKIDGSFIKNLLIEPYCELVVKFITSAARLHGRKTIAEYVENAKQLDKLRDFGVSFAQGFHTGKPELLFDPALN